MTLQGRRGRYGHGRTTFSPNSGSTIKVYKIVKRHIFYASDWPNTVLLLSYAKQARVQANKAPMVRLIKVTLNRLVQNYSNSRKQTVKVNLVWRLTEVVNWQ